MRVVETLQHASHDIIRHVDDADFRTETCRGILVELLRNLQPPSHSVTMMAIISIGSRPSPFDLPASTTNPTSTTLFYLPASST